MTYINMNIGVVCDAVQWQTLPTFQRNPLSPLARKNLESAVSPLTFIHVRLQVQPRHTWESNITMELQDVCCALGLWCHLVSGIGKSVGAEGKINLLFLTTWNYWVRWVDVTFYRKICSIQLLVECTITVDNAWLYNWQLVISTE